MTFVICKTWWLETCKGRQLDCSTLVRTMTKDLIKENVHQGICFWITPWRWDLPFVKRTDAGLNRRCRGSATQRLSISPSPWSWKVYKRELHNFHNAVGSSAVMCKCPSWMNLIPLYPQSRFGFAGLVQCHWTTSTAAREVVDGLKFFKMALRRRYGSWKKLVI